MAQRKYKKSNSALLHKMCAGVNYVQYKQLNIDRHWDQMHNIENVFLDHSNFGSVLKIILS